MRQWNVEHRNVEQKCCCVQVEKLTKAEFSEALFQLVDVWCEHVEAMELFAEFLKTVFQSITSFDRQDKCHRYKPMNQIRSLHDILEDIRSVTLQQHEMDEAAREQRRGELHAARGVRRAGGARTRGSVVRSSLLISTVLGTAWKGSTTWITPVASPTHPWSVSRMTSDKPTVPGAK